MDSLPIDKDGQPIRTGRVYYTGNGTRLTVGGMCPIPGDSGVVWNVFLNRDNGHCARIIRLPSPFTDGPERNWILGRYGIIDDSDDFPRMPVRGRERLCKGCIWFDDQILGGGLCCRSHELTRPERDASDCRHWLDRDDTRFSKGG